MKSFTSYFITGACSASVPATKKTFLFIALFFVVGLFGRTFAQTVVSGIVYDEKKITIPGVTVMTGNPLKGLASTNGRGEFRVTVKEGATLVFKFMGYVEKRVTLKPGQKNITVTMQED